jgi:hypothetical protein
MKFNVSSILLLLACAFVSALAAPSGSGQFRLKATGTMATGQYLENKDNRGVLSQGGKVVEARIPPDGTKTLVVNGLDGTPDYAFLTTSPGSKVWDIVFGDVSIPEVCCFP